MPSYLDKDAKRAIRLLRAALAPPIEIRTVPDEVLEKYHGAPAAGDCRDMGGYWLVRLARGNSSVEMVDAICEEVAHALDEFENGPAPRQQHRDSFGKWLSRCIRAVRE
jgi:hypothetical protein